ncbi:hypothetical protein Q765_20695 [Flavobacterium rivuli WB 3.3-2 = DSM 21788]|uniref:Uncharacterized protein n=1 Tax=Flavobacterium rivuli WB 3.3-2 = DSM 21788 TaxID=1121895 RepID=A0A0A2M8K0_9FLAO|nr:hypothetical protein [Flavobacterium rivuli]KGO84605.1 hypothetical protein Q765_20695 [Flavobacterium rivuli WB 3.3-2 = DSM 21788]
MKRIITILTGVALLCYFFIAIYNFCPPFYKQSYVGRASNKVSGILGFGVLFDRMLSLTGRSVTYRFYQGGRWQENKLLLEPLFDDYRATGNLTSLKHCRLDTRLVSDIHKTARRKGIQKMKESKAYAEFLDHLLYSHNQNIRPDSLEIFYYIRNYETDALHLSLNFKDKP